MSVISSHLQKDPILKILIETHGELDPYRTVPDIFSALVETIVGQQLSGRAADTIFGRFKELMKQTDPLSPEEIISMEDGLIRKAGLSYSKIKYIKNLAQQVVTKELDLGSLEKLADEEVIIHLTKVKGIGRWTAEMALMFILKRPDVFSMGDNGLRSAISKLYGIDKNDLKQIEKISMKWKPYRTYASRYLWKFLIY